jgi:hypothetical protein
MLSICRYGASPANMVNISNQNRDQSEKNGTLSHHGETTKSSGKSFVGGIIHDNTRLPNTHTHTNFFSGSLRFQSTPVWSWNLHWMSLEGWFYTWIWCLPRAPVLERSRIVLPWQVLLFHRTLVPRVSIGHPKWHILKHNIKPLSFKVAQTRPIYQPCTNRFAQISIPVRGAVFIPLVPVISPLDPSLTTCRAAFKTIRHSNVFTSWSIEIPMDYDNPLDIKGSWMTPEHSRTNHQPSLIKWYTHMFYA